MIIKISNPINLLRLFTCDMCRGHFVNRWLTFVSTKIFRCKMSITVQKCRFSFVWKRYSWNIFFRPLVLTVQGLTHTFIKRIKAYFTTTSSSILQILQHRYYKLLFKNLLVATINIEYFIICSTCLSQYNDLNCSKKIQMGLLLWCWGTSKSLSWWKKPAWIYCFLS